MAKSKIKLAIKIAAALLSLALFYIFIARNPERDYRLYIFIDQQIIAARDGDGVKSSRVVSVKQVIDNATFEADVYLTESKSMVVIVNEPQKNKSGWLISSLAGGKCYKLFGEGDIAAFLSESRRVCGLYHGKKPMEQLGADHE